MMKTLILLKKLMNYGDWLLYGFLFNLLTLIIEKISFNSIIQVLLF